MGSMCSKLTNRRSMSTHATTIACVPPLTIPGCPVPGVPGFRYCYDSNRRLNSVVSIHSFHGSLFAEEFPVGSRKIVTLNGALELIKADFTQQVNCTDQNGRNGQQGRELKFEPVPVRIWESANLSSTSFAIYLLAKGLYVACGPSFVAAFNIRLGCWFLGFVAVEPGRYLAVQLYAGLKYIAEFDWNGSIKATTVIRKNEQIPWKALGTVPKVHFFPPKTLAGSPNEVQELFVSWFHKIYAKTSVALYEFVQTPAGWAFKEVKILNRESRVGSCAPYLPEMEIQTQSQEIVVKSWEMDHLV